MPFKMMPNRTFGESKICREALHFYVYANNLTETVVSDVHVHGRLNRSFFTLFFPRNQSFASTSSNTIHTWSSETPAVAAITAAILSVISAFFRSGSSAIASFTIRILTNVILVLPICFLTLSRNLLSTVEQQHTNNYDAINDLPTKLWHLH